MDPLIQYGYCCFKFSQAGGYMSVIFVLRAKSHKDHEFKANLDCRVRLSLQILKGVDDWTYTVLEITL